MMLQIFFLCIIFMRRYERIIYFIGMLIILCRMGKLLLWMNTRVAPCQEDDGQMGCIKPLKQKKKLKLIRKIKRSHRLLSKIIFVYMSSEEKFAASVEDIKKTHATLQPILVGTASIEASEQLSSLLKQEKIPHQVLNAKFHEKEAQIVAEAGRPGAVTIATNMAGRGTDIVLGGNIDAEIKALDAPSP